MIFKIENISIDLKQKIVFIPLESAKGKDTVEFIRVPNDNIEKTSANKHSIDLSFLTVGGTYQIRSINTEEEDKYIENVKILHASDDNLEFVIQKFDDFNEDIDYTNYDFVTNYKDYRIIKYLTNANKMAIRVDEPVNKLNEPFFLQYHYFDTEEIDIELEEQPYEILTIYTLPPHKPKETVGKVLSGTTEYKVRPNIGDEVERIKSLYSNIIPLDYSEWSNHTRYGSANGRFKAGFVKIAKFIRDKGTFQISASTINDFVKNLNPYETWMFGHYSTYSASSPYNEGDYPKYKNALGDIIFYHPSSSQVENWYSYYYSESYDYDENNNDRIIYKVPQIYLEHDTNNAFTKLLDAFGDFIDFEIYLPIKKLVDKIYPEPYNVNFGSDKFLPEIIKRIYDIDINTLENQSLNEFYQIFSGSTTLNRNKFAEHLYTRLYSELPFLLQRKGTINVIKDIFNIIGVPQNWFEIYEDLDVDLTQNPEYATGIVSDMEDITELIDKKMIEDKLPIKGKTLGTEVEVNL